MVNKQERWAKTFASRMESAGWEPIRDAFGGVYEWKHGLSDKIVNHTAVFSHWWIRCELPAINYPFDKPPAGLEAEETA